MSQRRPHRRYDKAFKSQAVELAAQPGRSVQKAATDLDIPDHALYRWKKELAESGEDACLAHGMEFDEKYVFD